MSTLWHDCRFAIRTLGKRPGFTAAVVLVLGLGMGATTSVLDLTNLLAWRQVPAEQPDRLVKVFSAMHRGFVGPYGGTAVGDYHDYADASRSFEALAAHHEIEVRIDTGEETAVAAATGVSGNYFEVLDLSANRGRLLSVEDDRVGAAPAVVLAHHWWRRIGADQEILGRTLTVEGEPFTVVGVGPEGFIGTTAGEVADIFVGLEALSSISEAWVERLEDRQRAPLGMIGRLRPGVSRQAAEAELGVLAGQLDETYPLADDKARQVTVTAATITHPVDLERTAPSLRLFAIAVVLLLVITCANVAHLLLARAVTRGREMAVRRALGAGRGVLVRQLLTENLVLALAGGLCGFVLAWWMRGFLVAFAGAEFAAEARFDYRVIGASFLVCLVAALLFGSVPALLGSRIDLVAGLKGDSSHVGGRRRIPIGSVLATAQVGLCVVLLAAGALLARSLWNRLDTDFGIDHEGLYMGALNLPTNDYSPERGQALYETLRQRVEASPGIDRAGYGLIIPPILFDISVPVHLPEAPEIEHTTRVNLVDQHYFDTMGIAIERGRGFDTIDAASEAGVVVINRRLAETLWPGEDPIGRTLDIGTARAGDLGPLRTVIGVVGNIVQHRSSTASDPMLYHFTGQRYQSFLKLVVRSSIDQEIVFDGLRDTLRELDPGLALTMMRTGEANRREAFTFERMQAQAVALFAGAGFLLAILGIFGVLSYAVSRQIREIGIRMAIGAQRRDIRRQVVSRGLRMAVVGGVIGLATMPLLGRVLDHLLYGVGLAEPWTWLAVLSLVLLATAAAAVLPALRASRLDPLQALRHD